MRKIPQIKGTSPKPVVETWNKWAKGLNSLVAATKIRDDELSIANNVVLEDEGSPTRRPGSANWGLDAGGTTTQGMFEFYKSSGEKYIAKVEDGIFRYWTGSAWNIVSNHSFVTNAMLSATVLNDVLYMVNGQNPLTKYDGSSLIRYNLISAPTSNWAVLGGSLASGQYAISYRVSAVSAEETGETNAATAFTIYSNKQRDNWNPVGSTLNPGNSATVHWNTVTGAKGYNIYGVVAGDERYITYVDGQAVSSWQDLGTIQPSQVFPVPTGNSTQGVEGSIIANFKTSLIVAGDSDNPSRVYFSAGVDKPDSFLIGDGGGFIDVSKNSNDGTITALGTFQNKAIVGKERSMWELDFTTDIIPSLSNIVQGIGCVSHFTLVPVENDLFFLGRKPGGGAAIYILGNEPNYFNVLRTNELSARVRPTLAALQPDNFEKAFAVYFDGKYMLFHAVGGSTSNNAVLVYDRERLGFTYWNDGIEGKYPVVFYDAGGDEYLLYSDEGDNRVTEISSAFGDDKGSAIIWNYKTKETDADNPFLFKRYRTMNVRLRNVGGTITLTVWVDGETISYTIGVSGEDIDTAFGSGRFGILRFGITEDVGASASETNIRRRLPIGRQGINAIATSVGLEVSGNSVTSKAALLDVQIEAKAKSKNYYPRDEVVN